MTEDSQTDSATLPTQDTASASPPDHDDTTNTDAGKHSHNKELQELRDALTQAEDKHLRLLAEVENFKRRMQRDKDDLAHEVLARIIKDLLCVLDSFDKGKASKHDTHGDNATNNAYVQGMKLVEDQFRTVLTNTGLQPINSVGKLFDPNLHQAIQRVEVKSKADNDRVQTELAKGYTLKGRLLRPSMVSVGVYSGETNQDAD